MPQLAAMAILFTITGAAQSKLADFLGWILRWPEAFQHREALFRHRRQPDDTYDRRSLDRYLFRSDKT